MTVIKWPGGKRRQAARIDELFGSACSIHVEPFFGSGAVALHRLEVGRCARVVGFDVNARLIATHNAITASPAEISDWLRVWEAHPPDYLEMRRKFNEDPIEGPQLAAIFIWLNKACFNGLYRENARGYFNTPEGSGGFMLPSADQLFAASRLLQRATVHAASYLHADIRPGPGVHIYCDPPYWPRNVTFDYSASGFTAADQTRLAILAKAWAEAGSTVIVSNHDLPETRHLYRDAEIVAHEVSRPINSDPNGRGKVGELYAIWRPHVAN